MLLVGVIELDLGRSRSVSGSLGVPRSPRQVQAAFGYWLRTLIEVGAVMVLFVELAHVELIGSEVPFSYLTTGHTTTTRMLSVLAYTTRVFR